MKIGRGFLFFLLLSFMVAKAVFCYDNLITHPRLSTKAIEVYNQTSDDKINQEESAWIIHGAIAEDTDPRYLNHFYNPETGKGLYWLTQHVSAKDWAQNQMSVSGNYDVGTILQNYKEGNRKRAWQGVGHILHLVQDMTVPAHVRDDAHMLGDSYEEWSKRNGSISSFGYKKYSVSGINEVFDKLAGFTHDNFFSKDTINDELVNNFSVIINKNINGDIAEYLVKDNYKVAQIISSPRKKTYLFDYKVHQDYWNILAPKAIGYSAGVLEWFKNEFAEIDKEKAKLSLLEKIKSFLASRTWQISQGMNYAYGDIYLPGQVLRDEALGEVKSAVRVSILAYEIGKEKAIEAKQKINNKAEKAVVKLDEIIDSSSSNTRKVINDAVAQIKVLGESLIYQESEVSAEGLTASNSVGTDSDWEEVSLDRVIDGDTIVLQNGDRVRYIGVDSPELNKAGPDDDECLAWVAKVRNEQLLKSGEIKLLKDKTVDKDKYGRLLRYVYVGDNFVNATLAREGLAETFFCKVGWKNCPVTSDLTRQGIIEEANESAQKNKRGIYSQVCLAEKPKDKVVVEKGEEKQVASEPVLKPENFIIFHSGGASKKEIESLDNQNLENQDTSVQVSFFNLFDIETLNPDYTASTTVGIDLEITNKDLAKTFCLSEEENYPDFTDSCWQAGVSSTYELSSENGLKKVYLFIRQGEKVIRAYDTIYLDTDKLQIYFGETPTAYASSSDAVFVLGSNKSIISKYSLDNASSTFANIGEEILIENLGEAEHNFYFEGLAQNGEIASTTYRWLIDLSAPVVDLEVSKNDEDFNLSWEAEDVRVASSSAGIDFYNLFYQVASTSPWEIILKNTQATSTVFNLASSSEETIFGVEAIDRAGNKSKLSLASTSKEVVQKINHIVISEVQFASAESAKDEFIELYNLSDEEINLFGYRLSRKTKSGSETNLLTEFPEVMVPAHGYYLVTHEEYDGINPADSVYSTSQSIADDNTIILYSDAGETVVDKLGVGEASDFEGEVFGDNPDKSFSLERKSLASSTQESISEDRENFGNAYDSDNNSLDFIIQAEPNPRGLNLAPTPKKLSDNLEYLWHFDECIGYQAYDSIQAGVIEDNFAWSEGVWGCSSSLQKTVASSETDIMLSNEKGISVNFFLQSGKAMESVALFSDEANREIKLALLGGDLLLWDGESYQALAYASDTNWHNYTLTLNKKLVRVFVDGVLRGELNLDIEFNNFSKLKLGEAGMINFDELAIWSRVLSEEEIVEIYNRTEPLEPVLDYNQEKRLYEWKSGEATSTVMTELVQGDDLEIGEAEWKQDPFGNKYFLNIASSTPLEKYLMTPITESSFSINYLFGHSAMGKNIDNALLLSSDVGLFGFRLYDGKADVYVNDEIFTFDCNYSAGLLSLVFASEKNKFYFYGNGSLLGEGEYNYQNHKITSYQISTEEDNYMFYSLSIWDGVLTTNQIRRLMMEF